MTVSALVLLGLLEPAAEGPSAQPVPQELVVEQRLELLEPPSHVEETLQQHDLLPPELEALVSRSVINTVKLWAPGSRLNVCFKGGSNELNARIAELAQQWNDVANIELSFGGDERAPALCKHGDNADIRVGYEPSGYWSVVGRSSRAVADRDHTTLNLDGFHVAPPSEAEFVNTVLHEFGHALGLEHEHQNPNGSCADELDWVAVHRHFARAPNYWSVAETNLNLGPLLASSVNAGAYDPKSVMHYVLPDGLFRDPSTARCRVGLNTRLSAGDKQALRRAYPGPRRAVAKLSAEVRVLANDIARAEGLEASEEEKLLRLREVLERELASLQGRVE